MTTINVTTETAEILVTESNGASTTVTTASVPSVLTATTAGPQGPPGANIPIATDNPENGSVIYYDRSVGIFRADAIHTFVTLADGGNF